MTLNNKTNILTIQNLMLGCRGLREKIICSFVKSMWSRSLTGEGHIVFVNQNSRLARKKQPV